MPTLALRRVPRPLPLCGMGVSLDGTDASPARIFSNRIDLGNTPFISDPSGSPVLPVCVYLAATASSSSSLPSVLRPRDSLECASHACAFVPASHACGLGASCAPAHIVWAERITLRIPAQRCFRHPGSALLLVAPAPAAARHIFLSVMPSPDHS